MTVIRASCSQCGEVRLRPRDIDLVVTGRGDGDGRYAFDCPQCGTRTEKPADRRIVALLVQGDVRVRRDPPAFSAADLVAFGRLLDRPDWQARMDAAWHHAD